MTECPQPCVIGKSCPSDNVECNVDGSVSQHSVRPLRKPRNFERRNARCLKCGRRISARVLGQAQRGLCAVCYRNVLGGWDD